MINTIADNKEILILVVGIILGLMIISLIVFMVLLGKKKKRQQTSEKSLPETFITDLIDALGTIDNIKDLSIEHHRLGIILNNLSLISLPKLKEMQVSAFMKGNEIKILMKTEPKKVYDFIKELKGGK